LTIAPTDNGAEQKKLTCKIRAKTYSSLCSEK